MTLILNPEPSKARQTTAGSPKGSGANQFLNHYQRLRGQASPQLQPTRKIAKSETLKPPFVPQKHQHVAMTILDLTPQRAAPSFPTAFSQAPTSSGTAIPGFAASTAFQVFSSNSAMYST